MSRSLLGSSKNPIHKEWIEKSERISLAFQRDQASRRSIRRSVTTSIHIRNQRFSAVFSGFQRSHVSDTYWYIHLDSNTLSNTILLCYHCFIDILEPICKNASNRPCSRTWQTFPIRVLGELHSQLTIYGICIRLTRKRNREWPVLKSGLYKAGSEHRCILNSNCSRVTRFI